MVQTDSPLTWRREEAWVAHPVHYALESNRKSDSSPPSQEHLPLDRHAPTGRDAVEDRRPRHIGPGAHPAGAGHREGRFLHEPVDMSRTVDVDQAERADGSGDLGQRDGGLGLPIEVEGDHGRHVQVGEHVAVEVVGRVPVLDHLQALVGLSAQGRLREVVGNEDRAHGRQPYSLELAQLAKQRLQPEPTRLPALRDGREFALEAGQGPSTPTPYSAVALAFPKAKARLDDPGVAVPGFPSPRGLTAPVDVVRGGGLR
jgi:hypothetical protein